jgi:hypothetical protein
MLIMAFRSPVASEHLRSIDNDDAALAQVSVPQQVSH